MGTRPCLTLVALTVFPYAGALAQTDEIQVYDATIAEPGQVDMTVHANYTPRGRTDADFAGGVVPNHSVNGAFEFAYGLREDWELGLYLPVYTYADSRLQFDGAKLRSLWVSPQARQRRFFYGLNIEYSFNAPHWDNSRTSLEIRPIVGVRAGHWDFILNPIIDSDFDGLGRMHAEPAARVAYNFSDTVATAVETYSDLGPLSHMYSWQSQAQTMFAVIDWSTGVRSSVELGVGHGFTSESDAWVVKAIWNHSF
jgi:hypothetical protein